MKRFPVQLCAIVLTAGWAYGQNSIVEPDLTPAEDDEQAYYEPGGETFIGTGSVAWNAMLRDTDQKRAIQEARQRKMMYHRIAEASGPMPSYNSAESFLKANPPVPAAPLQGQRPVSTVRQTRPGEEVPAFERSYGSPQPEAGDSNQIAAQPVVTEPEKPGFFSKLFRRGGRDNPPDSPFQGSSYPEPTGGEESNAGSSYPEPGSSPLAVAEPVGSESSSYEGGVETAAMEDALTQATNTPGQGGDGQASRQPGIFSRIFERRGRPETVGQTPSEPAQPPAPSASTRPPGFLDDPSVVRAIGDEGEGETTTGAGEDSETERETSPGSGLDGGIPRPPAPGQ